MKEKDITFLVISLVITMSIWIVYAVVMDYEWQFVGITLLLNGLCYLCHKIVNGRNNHG